MPNQEPWRDWPEPPSTCLDRANAADTWQDWRVDTNACRAVATEKVIAHMLCWRSQYDSWYLAYGYEYGGRVFHFAWETPYDELHRGFAKNAPAEWYDGMGEGQPFGVLVDPNEPWRHHIATPPFTAMNGSIVVLAR